jgi:hypothetical protein
MSLSLGDARLMASRAIALEGSDGASHRALGKRQEEEK